jgi:transcriptional regulator with XRE-family HTH domain
MITPEPAELTVGQRIRLHRERSGKSRTVLGGLVGKSSEWVKAIETGRLLPPRLPMLSMIAKTLRVSVTALVDRVEDLPDRFGGPGHALLPAVRDAVNRFDLSTPGAPPPLGHLRDCQLATRSSVGGRQREAYALLAETLGLAQMFLAYQPATDLLWRVTDRAMLAARESGSPVALAGAAWFLIEAQRETGDWDTASALAQDATAAIEPALPDGGDDLLALYGSLQAAAAFTAARAGEEGRAWRYWDAADATADRLPAGYVQRWTSFSRPVMTAHAVTLAVELRKGGEAVRQARRTPASSIASRPRRARHLIELARGHDLRREPRETMTLLQQAYETAPETIRYNGYARRITTGLLEGPAAMRRDAYDLAIKVGLVDA